MLRSFNATIDAEITEIKLAEKLKKREQSKLLEAPIQIITHELDQDSSSSNPNTSGMDDSSAYDSARGHKSAKKHSSQFDDLQKQRHMKEQQFQVAQKFN